MRHGAVPSVEFSHSGQYAGTYMADKNKKQGLTQYGPSDCVRPSNITSAIYMGYHAGLDA